MGVCGSVCAPPPPGHQKSKGGCSRGPHPESRLSVRWSLISPGHRLYSPFPASTQVGSGTSSRCPGQPQPCTLVPSAVSNLRTLPREPHHSSLISGHWLAFAPGAGCSQCWPCSPAPLLAPWTFSHPSLGASYPPVWLERVGTFHPACMATHFASICQGILGMQFQEKLPRGNDFLRRSGDDDKFLKEKQRFI